MFDTRHFKALPLKMLENFLTGNTPESWTPYPGGQHFASSRQLVEGFSDSIAYLSMTGLFITKIAAYLNKVFSSYRIKQNQPVASALFLPAN